MKTDSTDIRGNTWRYETWVDGNRFVPGCSVSLHEPRNMFFDEVSDNICGWAKTGGVEQGSKFENIPKWFVLQISDD